MVMGLQPLQEHRAVEDLDVDFDATLRQLRLDDRGDRGQDRVGGMCHECVLEGVALVKPRLLEQCLRPLRAVRVQFEKIFVAQCALGHEAH